MADLHEFIVTFREEVLDPEWFPGDDREGRLRLARFARLNAAFVKQFRQKLLAEWGMEDQVVSVGPALSIVAGMTLTCTDAVAERLRELPEVADVQQDGMFVEICDPIEEKSI